PLQHRLREARAGSGPWCYDQGRTTKVHWLPDPDRSWVGRRNNRTQPTSPKEASMSKRSNRTAALAIMSALARGTIATVPAYASGGATAVTRRGTCTGASLTKITAKHDDGVIETQFEVDSNRVGQVWNVVIKDNGVTVFTGSRT